MWFKFYQRYQLFYNNLKEKIRDPEFHSGYLLVLPYIIGSVVAAFIAVSYSKLFHSIEYLMANLANYNPYWFLAITPMAFYISWWLVNNLAPGASGSGIPQLLAALDRINSKNHRGVNHLLSIKIAFIKILSSLVALFGGAAIGREGPTLQISASIFHGLRNILPKFWPYVSRQNMLISGGAAGLAAAFNTPLGGIVFAIEELTRTHINYFRTSLFIAVILAGLTAQWLLGPYLFIGYPKVQEIGFVEFLLVIVIAGIAGLLGAFKSVLILKIQQLRRTYFKGKKEGYYVIGVGFLFAFGIIAFGQYMIGSGKEMMSKDILFNATPELPWYIFILRFVASIASYSLGIAGGIFATALSTGAALGQFIVDVFQLDAGNKVFILVAMIGFLTGITRSPFTSAVLVLEMTDRHSAIFPMMLAAMIAYVVARRVDKRSLYSYIEEDFLHQEQKEKLRKENPHNNGI